MAHHVVVGALVGAEGILIVHRRPDRLYYPDCWDFPGGHVEHGESPGSAVARELKEELGVTAVVRGGPRLRIREDADRPDGLVLDLWVVSEWTGEPANVAADEHDDIRWVRVGDTDGLRFAHPSCHDLISELS